MLRDVLRESCHWQKRGTRELVKAKDLAEHYSMLFKAGEAESVPLSEGFLPMDSPITLDEVGMALRTLKDRKSPSENDIRSELLKWGGNMLACRLLEVFNDYWYGDTPLPRTWIEADVVSIYKRKGAKADPANYRSIFLLDTIGKL